MFAVNTDLCDFDPMLYEIAWADAELKKTDVPHNYEISLIKKDTTVVVTAYQVFSNEEYQKELRDYEAAKRSFEAQKKKNSELSDQQQKGFITEKLGALSFETKLEMQDYESVQLKFATPGGEEIQIERVFLAEQGGKRLLSYNSDEVMVLPGKSYIVWATTQDGLLMMMDEAKPISTSALKSPIIVNAVHADAGFSQLQDLMD
jgi:hypothetical protein